MTAPPVRTGLRHRGERPLGAMAGHLFVGNVPAAIGRFQKQGCKITPVSSCMVELITSPPPT